MKEYRSDLSALILMTSYNGEKYIGKQIESIINQTVDNWHLIIRDDGSNDTTVEIIKTYCVSDDRIQLFQNETSRHGVYLNFFTLIDYAKKIETYDYYFFADQDDIWFEDRLQEMMLAAERCEHYAQPLLAYSDMQIIDENDELTYPSLNEIMGISEIGEYSLFFTHGFLWGCDVLINRKLFELVPCLPLNYPNIGIMSHDNYYGKFALIYGKVLYVQKPYIRHRRHGKNTTGQYKMKLTLVSILSKFFGGYAELTKTHARVYNQTLCFAQQAKLNGLQNSKVDQLEQVIEKGGVYAVLQMIKWKVKRKQISRTIGIYVVMLLKSYKKHSNRIDFEID